MKGTNFLVNGLMLLIFTATSIQASVIDAPHNDTNHISCVSCHSYSLWWKYSPNSQHTSDHKTLVISVCMACHETGGYAPMAKTHSALTMGSTYYDGEWAIGCTECHNPHYQEQLNWIGTSTSPFLINGVITDVAINTPQPGQSTITYSGATTNPGWPAEGAAANDLDWARKNQSGRGLILVQDTTEPTNTFSIIAANANQIVIKGLLDPGTINPAHPGNRPTGNSFGLIYGQLVKSRIITPASGPQDVKFFNPIGGFVNAETPVSGVCQVCHTATGHFRNTGEVNIGNAGLNHTGQTGDNCIRCHAHGSGFAHGAGGTSTGCGTTTECHGTQGSHPAHVNPAGMVKTTCGVCHDQNNFPTFADGATTIPATSVCNPCHDNGKGAVVTPPVWGAASPSQCSECHAVAPDTGSHPKHLAAAGIGCVDCHKDAAQGVTAPSQHLDGDIDVYKTSPGDLGYPADKAKGSAAATCSVTACHGSGVPRWGVSSTGACGTCHGTTATNPPLLGSHKTHTMNDTWSHAPNTVPPFNNYIYGRNMACTVCHKDFTVKHVNGSADWSFDTVTFPGLSEAKYKGGSTGSASPVSGAYGQCTNLYCHSIVQTSTGGPLTGLPGEYTTPTWGSLDEGTCGTCHYADQGHSYWADKGMSAPEIGSGSHAKHLQSLTLTVGGGSNGPSRCAACHNYVGTDNLLGCASVCHNRNGLHVDYKIDVMFPPMYGGTIAAYNGTSAPGDGFGNCSSTYCHSNGTSVSTGAIPVNTSPIWGAVDLTCNACHGYPPDYANGSPKTNSHSRHAQYLCNSCHANTTSDGNSITGKTYHVNRGYDVTSGTGASFSYTFSVSGGTCSNISCHGNGNATWGGTVTCGDCHAVP